LFVRQIQPVKAGRMQFRIDAGDRRQARRKITICRLRPARQGRDGSRRLPGAERRNDASTSPGRLATNLPLLQHLNLHAGFGQQPCAQQAYGSRADHYYPPHKTILFFFTATKSDLYPTTAEWSPHVQTSRTGIVPMLRSNHAGHTLAELLIVIGLLAILANIALPALGKMQQERRNEAAFEAMNNLLHHARARALIQKRTLELCPSADGVRCSTDWNLPWLLRAA